MAILTPTRAENITVSVSIFDAALVSWTVQVSGMTPAFLDYGACVQGAALQSQGNAVVSNVSLAGFLLMYLDETSYMSVPLVDQTGNRWVNACGRQLDSQLDDFSRIALLFSSIHML